MVFGSNTGGHTYDDFGRFGHGVLGLCQPAWGLGSSGPLEWSIRASDGVGAILFVAASACCCA
jgi:hypothetical protein